MTEPKTNGNEHARHSLAVLGGTMLFLQVTASLCYPIAKYGLEQIEPFTFAFYRFLLASAVLLTIALFISKKPRIERRDAWRIVGLGVLIVPLNQTLFLVGQSMTGAGHGALLFATTPVWVFVLALIHLKEHTNWRRTTGIIVALAGVMIILLSGAFEVGTEYLWGDLVILIAVMAWGYYTILGKRLVVKYGALRVTAYSLAAGSTLYFPFGFYQACRFDYSQVTLGAWGSIAYMAIGLSVIVYVLWYWLLKQLDASRIAVYHNIQPVIASAVAYFFLGESLGLAFIVGGFVVIGGVILTEL